MKISPTRGVIAIQDIKDEGSFATPIQKGDLRKGKVIAVGAFLWHINGHKVFAEPKVGDIVVFTYNGNETVMGTNIHLAIFDQLRAIIK